MYLKVIQTAVAVIASAAFVVIAITFMNDPLVAAMVALATLAVAGMRFVTGLSTAAPDAYLHLLGGAFVMVGATVAAVCWLAGQVPYAVLAGIIFGGVVAAVGICLLVAKVVASEQAKSVARSRNLERTSS
jgi:hypothetical protein